MSSDEPPSPGQLVGARIRAMRLAKKLTQSQLAKPDFSVSYISAIERGQIQPSLRALAILSARLGLASTQLLSGGDIPDDAHDALSLSKTMHGEEVELALLEAQVYIQQGKAQEAIEQLQQVVAKNLQRQQQIQIRYLLGWAHLLTGQYEKSKDGLLEATRLIKEPVDRYINVHILNMLGRVYAATHDHAEAFGAYQRCLDLLTGDHNPFLMIQVYASLGEHYMYVGQFGQAVEMFQRAAEASGTFATARQLRSTYWDICKHYMNLGAPDLAALHAHKAAHLDSQEARHLVRSELYHYLCHAMMRGDQERGRAYLETALQQERDGQDQLTIASITSHLARWLLEQGGLAEAQKKAQQAYEGAKPFGDTIIAAEVSVLLGRIAYAQARFKEGDRYFVAGLEMLERLGKHEELANELVGYAQLLEENQRMQEAYKYLKRAYEMHTNS